MAKRKSPRGAPTNSTDMNGITIRRWASQLRRRVNIPEGLGVRAHYLGRGGDNLAVSWDEAEARGMVKWVITDLSDGRIIKISDHPTFRQVAKELGQPLDAEPKQLEMDVEPKQPEMDALEKQLVEALPRAGGSPPGMTGQTTALGQFHQEVQQLLDIATQYRGQAEDLLKSALRLERAAEVLKNQ